MFKTQTPIPSGRRIKVPDGISVIAAGQPLIKRKFMVEHFGKRVFVGWFTEESCLKFSTNEKIRWRS